MIKKIKIKELKNETTGTPFVEDCKCGIDKLTITFQNVDMNKVVEKINEIIEKSNECTI